MNKAIKKIIEESGTTNVKNIEFDEKEDVWRVTYKNNLKPDEFRVFEDVLTFFKEETASND